MIMILRTLGSQVGSPAAEDQGGRQEEGGGVEREGGCDRCPLWSRRRQSVIKVKISRDFGRNAENFSRVSVKSPSLALSASSSSSASVCPDATSSFE